MNPSPTLANNNNPHIVIVGGGAGGLELATRLGDKLGRRGRARITLVDRNPTHVWKPFLHEIAAGSLDVHVHQLDYLAQAYRHHFRFRLGALEAIDRERQEITVGAMTVEGIEMLPRRIMGYDALVLALGSTTNDFGIRGAAENAIALDTSEDAERLHRLLIAACVRADASATATAPGKVEVVIIGAGATGVELAAEIRSTTRMYASYGFDNLDPRRDIKLTIVETSTRILPALPERIAVAAAELLANMGVDVLCGDPVTAVEPDHVATKGGKRVAADLTVWAAGIKAPPPLPGMESLESNGQNQLVVHATLQTTRDARIFAIGDCAACPWLGRDGRIPPRAQAAHQQASLLAGNLQRLVEGRPLQPFHFRDFGSLVSLADVSAVGNLMGAVFRGSFFLEGQLARLMYWSTYQLHVVALHGYVKTALGIVGQFIRNRTEPRVKLH